MVNIPRLKHLAEVLEAVPDEKLDMSALPSRDPYFCGCAAHYAIHDPQFKREGLWALYFERYDGFSAPLAGFFELSQNETRLLFNEDCHWDVAKHQVLANIEALIEGRKPEPYGSD